MSQSDVDFEVLDDSMLMSVLELARACGADVSWIEELASHGVVQPASQQQASFAAVSVVRLAKARRLQRDFDLSPAGTALVLELLDEIERLRAAPHSGGLS